MADHDYSKTSVISAPLKQQIADSSRPSCSFSAQKRTRVRGSRPAGDHLALEGVLNMFMCFCVCVFGERGMPFNIWQHVSSISFLSPLTAVDPWEHITQTLPGLFPVVF